MDELVPVDPDVDLAADGTWCSGELPVVAVVAAGGVVGAVTRYEAGRLWPTASGAFPWTTFGINVLGCALIGVLMVLVAERFAGRLVRPFVGTGILGGFTTFSTYAVDIRRLLADGEAGRALAYLAATVVAALVAVVGATRLARAAIRRGRR